MQSEIEKIIRKRHSHLVDHEIEKILEEKKNEVEANKPVTVPVKAEAPKPKTPKKTTKTKSPKSKMKKNEEPLILTAPEESPIEIVEESPIEIVEETEDKKEPVFDENQIDLDFTND